MLGTDPRYQDFGIGDVPSTDGKGSGFQAIGSIASLLMLIRNVSCESGGKAVYLIRSREF